MPKRLIIVLSLLFVFALAGLAAAGEMQEEYKIKFGVEAISIKIKKMGEGRWTARIDDQKYSLQTHGQGKYEYKWPDGQLDGKLASDKFKLKKGAEDFLEVKFTADKIKIQLPDTPDQWELKYKDGRIKIEKADVEMGKVQYYPDNGKIKAKDAAGTEVAEMKDSGRLRAVVAPFLMGEAVPMEQRIFLVLLFFSLDK
jgi:hypothetical protein